MVPMRSEQEEGTGVTFASGRPRFVMRMPSAGSPSNNCRHCSRKSLTFNVFIAQVYRILYISPTPVGRYAEWHIYRSCPASKKESAIVVPRAAVA